MEIDFFVLHLAKNSDVCFIILDHVKNLFLISEYSVLASFSFSCSVWMWVCVSRRCVRLNRCERERGERRAIGWCRYDLGRFMRRVYSDCSIVPRYLSPVMNRNAYIYTLGEQGIRRTNENKKRREQ